MAFKLADLYFRISSDTKKFDRGMAKSKKKVNTMTKTLGAFKTMLIGAFAGIGLRAVSRFLSESTRLYDIQAKAEAGLLTALKGREDVQKRLMEQASALQRITLFGDEETIKAQALIAMFVKEEAAIKRIIPLVQDFATAKSMNLAAAADLVSKTLGSTTNAMTRYGITVTGAVGSTERLTTLAEGLANAFEGQSEAAALAGTGGVTQLKNAFGDLREEIGGKLAPALNKLARGLLEMTDIISDEAMPGWRKFGKLMMETLYGAGDAWDALFSKVDAFGGKVRIMTRETKNALDAISAKQIPFLQTQAISGRMPPIDLTRARRAMGGRAPGRLPGRQGQEQPLSIGMAGLAGGFEQNAVALATATQRYADAMAPITQMNDVIKQSFVDLGVTLGEGLGDVFTGLMTAEGVFDTILKSVAKFAGKFGAMLVAIGVAEMAFLKSFNPGAKIIAGIALIALSRIAMNLMTADKTGGGSSVGGGGGSYTSHAQSIQVGGVLRGEDIYFSNQKTEERFNRLGAG